MECRQASGNKVKDAGDHLRFWRCFRTRTTPGVKTENNGEKGKKKGPMVLALLHHKALELCCGQRLACSIAKSVFNRSEAGMFSVVHLWRSNMEAKRSIHQSPAPNMLLSSDSELLV